MTVIIAPVRCWSGLDPLCRFDLAGELLLRAYETKEGVWLFPLEIRLPEQAPESASWQKFWSLPGVAELAEIRRANGLDPHIPKFGSAANP